ncbi:MAG: hypothetical protein QGF20_01385, partial [Alphaproteobacteria bacterium]|nr:hypothetical protein [Alphaproteobacteria bacterium]
SISAALPTPGVASELVSKIRAIGVLTFLPQITTRPAIDLKALAATYSWLPAPVQSGIAAFFVYGMTDGRD